MILLNKFIQCLNFYYTSNHFILNPSYISGCLANSIILQRIRQNIIFNHFDTTYRSSYNDIKLYINGVLKVMIFRKNDHVKQLEIYLSKAQKIILRINYDYVFIYTDRDIKDILSLIYG